ncbi:unnamed protein product, partial [Mesorhabditis belari]|uniref:DUF8077 domain-containing protein n=1 Tax=Mesorhabditis belari TaxID=2138241 RepID=A0AAF3ETS4_9BILA
MNGPNSIAKSFLIFTLLFVVESIDLDPTSTELDLLDWSGGIRVAFCTDAPLPDVISPFRRALSKITTKYCQNVTACNLKKQVVFQPEQILFIDGFPRREFGELHLKFLIVLPHSSVLETRQQRPLLPRQVISDMLGKHRGELASRLGWNILSYERYPRFDPMTEFMNIAIIPIIIFSIPLMIFLAYWTSTLRPNMGSESWLVTGSSGGKNAALRRTMEIIAEQNEEIKRQEMADRMRDLKITGAHEGLSAPAHLLLNVARLSIASSSYSANLQLSPSQPQLQPMSPPPVIIAPSSRRSSTISGAASQRPPSPPSSSSSQAAQRGLLQMRDANPHFKGLHPGKRDRRSSRRQSSIEGALDKRARKRGLSISSAPGAQRWKTGSLVLSRGFRK